MPLEIERVESATDDVRLLIGELDAELNAAYPPEQRHGLDLRRILQPGVSFFVARLDGEPAGCGGVAFADGLAEVKRMYVRPSMRGRGVAQALVRRIEDEARARGATRLVLETGDAQAAALRFYARAGFTRRGAFGQYARMPPAAVGRCVFFEKNLE
jgi:putative acetyltransferase